MNVTRTDFNETACKIMVDILNTTEQKHLNATALAKLINVSRTSPVYNEVLNFLKENGGIEVIEEIKPMKLLILNRKTIKNIIDEMESLNWWVNNFLKVYHEVNWVKNKKW